MYPVLDNYDYRIMVERCDDEPDGSGKVLSGWSMDLVRRQALPVRCADGQSCALTVQARTDVARQFEFADADGLGFELLAAEAIWQFNKEIVDKTYDLIPAVKPQIAMYEQFGVPGIEAFKKTVDYCKSKDLVVIGDIKRGDIGSTSAAYAVGHLGSVKVGSKEYVPFDEDFATVNPYLGSDGVNPFIDVCKEHKKGLFILVKTSNPSSGEFQDQLIDGKPLYELVGEKVAQWGADCMGDEYSYIGAVVGATYPEMGKILRKVMPKSYILVPDRKSVV